MNDQVGNTAWGQAAGYRTSGGVDATAIANRQALIDAYDEIAAGNWEPFWLLFDAEATFHEAPCLPYGGSHRGLDATKKAFAEISRSFAALRAEYHEVLTAGEYCIAYLTIDFQVQEHGADWRLPVAEIFRFRDGRIIEWRINYFDATIMLQALGGPS
jgi:hypothetical protein